MLPVVQDFTDLEAPGEQNQVIWGKDVPYMPSFVLPLSELNSSIKNIKDLVFLTGFNNPTLAVLYEPTSTWVGRLDVLKDTVCLDIWTLDIVSQTYANLTTVKGLPSDCEYLVACPTEIGGVMIVAGSSLIHVDQNGNTIITSVNGWFKLISNQHQLNNKMDRSHENLMLELESSQLTYITSKEMLLILKNGSSYQITIKTEGRNVSKLTIGRKIEMDGMCRPNCMARIGEEGLFIGSAVGDSVLVSMEKKEIEREVEGGHETEMKMSGMEVDLGDG